MKKKRDIQYRELGDISVLSQDEDSMVISGFIPYNKRSENMGFYEYVMPTAFRKTLSDGADVRALLNHDTSKLIGRVSNGSLKLESREDGLYAECTLPNTQYARDAYELIKGGYNNGLSFGFSIINEDYTYEDGFEVHYLREVKLYEISWAVSFPAYESTNSTIVRGIDLSNLGAVLGKEELTEEDLAKVKDTIEELNKLLPEEEEKIEEVSTSAVIEDTEAEDEEDLKFLTDVLEDIKTLLEK